MTIHHTCSSCGHRMAVPDHYAGRELFCTSCKEVFVAPGVEDEVPPPPPPPTGTQATGLQACPACGAAGVAGATFCGSCGSPFAAVPASGGLLRRPGVVTLLAVLQFISSTFLLLLAVLMLVVVKDEPIIGLAFGVFYLVMCGLALACGIGLWKLRPWGRVLQICLSAIGLLAIPLGTLISGLILYYLFRPEVKILFSGRTEAELQPFERATLAQSRSVNVGAVVAVVVAVALMVIAFVGIIAAIAVPNLINAIGRGRQKRSMADMRTIAVAIETYAVDNNEYPRGLTSMDELEPIVVPVYLRNLPRVDGWETPFELWTSEDGMAYQIVCYGRDGKPGQQNGGPTQNFDDDIVYRNGVFRQWPKGIEPE